MVTHGAHFSVYQIMFGSQKCELWKCEMGYSQFYYISILSVLGWEFTVNSHTQQPQIFWHLQNFHMAGTPWPKNQIQSCLQRWGNRILILFWIAANYHHWQYSHRNTLLLRRNFFTHPPLLEVWPYSQNFWSQNFYFLTPHSLISRVKSPLWIQTGLPLYLSTMLV